MNESKWRHSRVGALQDPLGLLRKPRLGHRKPRIDNALFSELRGATCERTAATCLTSQLAQNLTGGDQKGPPLVPCKLRGR